MGRELSELIPAPERFWAAVDGLERGATVALIALTGRRADGVPFALDARLRVLADGRLLCALRAVDRNGAPRRQPIDLAFDAMPIGMALFKTDGEYVRVNGALCELLGRGADELLGMRDQELTHPDDRQSLRRRRVAHPRRRAELVAVREALRAPRTARSSGRWPA